MKNILLLVVLILLTAGAYLVMAYMRGKRATHFGNLSTLQRVHGFKRFYLNPLILVFKVLIVSLLFLAATDSIDLRQVRPIVDTQFVVLLDSSSSMAKADYSPSRFEAAKKVSNEWLNMLPEQTAVGFVSFSQEVQTVVPFTTNHQDLSFAIDAATIEYSQSAGTNFDAALGKAFELFPDDSSKKAVLIFTDGVGEVAPLTLARSNQKGIRYHIFGIGGNQSLADDIPEEFRDLYSNLDLNITKLSEMANATGGRAYEITSNQQLLESFRDATLEDVQIKLNTNYYIIVLISLLSIGELILYSWFGAL